MTRRRTPARRPCRPHRAAVRRLHEELAEVRASRARIVEAADATRLRIERELHDGAQQRLLAVALAVRVAHRKASGAGAGEVAELLDGASAELSDVLAGLRELTRCIHPTLLTDAGLGPALTALAERCALPAVLHATPARHLARPVERTCYVVVSEALANAVEHAFATRIDIVVRQRGDQVAVEVSDDGVGGADPQGTGLRGLADRVAAAGGSLRVVSPSGAGTRVLADLPCG